MYKSRAKQRDKQPVSPCGFKSKYTKPWCTAGNFYLPDSHGDKQAENDDKKSGGGFSPCHPAKIHFSLSKLAQGRTPWQYDFVQTR